MTPLDVFGPRSWARPESVSFGREPMTTGFSRATRQPLDGRWAFTLEARPEDVRSDHLVGSTDGWADVEVPGCWTMQGFDRPQYTNVTMPFPGPPPRVPDENPTGVYRRPLEVPEDWSGQRIVVHVGGAESVLYVHLDGVAVGMGKDSRLPHEFDLTELVEPGRAHDLALTVVRWSDATYLEDQDHWYHGGLHRSVFVYATPRTHIADVHTIADYDPDTGTGRLEVRTAVGAPGFGEPGWSVRVEVAGQTSTDPVAVSEPEAAEFEALSFGGRVATATIELPGADPWTAETPALSAVVVTLLDPDGTEVDVVGLDVGFRRVEIVDAELRVNGRPILVKGVNRHDHDARTGKTVTPASIEADIVAMKRHNLNAVRTSHYPNDPALYEVCDRLGMYVVDEADIETHAHLRSLTKDPAWGPAILERMTRMAQRDKNHPCIIMWSLGNESGSAPIHRAGAEWLRGFDPTRPIQYEGGLADDLFGDLTSGVFPEMPELFSRPHPETDIVAPMYPSVDDIVGWARWAEPTQPLIMCEYIHAMGNSCGGLDDYWDAIRSTPGLQGGFAWDWVDQALVQAMPDGTERLAYGGDFGDEPNDGPFCCNGLVAADRTPHPSLLEMKAVVAPVQVRADVEHPGRFAVTNEHTFVDLSWLTCGWELAVDGEPLASGAVGVVAADPGETVAVDVPIPPLDLGPGEVATATVSFVTSEPLPWAEAGHEVAWGQSIIERADGPSVAPGPDAPVADRLPDDAPTDLPAAEGAAGSSALDRFEPVLALWRAPIDNETFGPLIGLRHAQRWEQMGIRDSTGIATMQTRTVPVEGGVAVEHEVTVPDACTDIPRVGVRLHLGPGVDRIDWLGDGPHECYSDRRVAARFGRWSVPVDEWTVPYVHPQASGNRTGVRWVRFLDGAGHAVLTIDQMDGLDLSVSRWTDDEVADAAHLEDLPAQDDCWVWIDAAHRGVGSAAVGPDVAPPHRVGPGSYSWSYRLARPIGVSS